MNKKPNDTSDLIKTYERYLAKALVHLEKSYTKALKIPTKAAKCSDDDLETWESFTSRFARVVDIYLTKYLRFKVIEIDPGFDGTLRDKLDFSEKAKLIDNADLWMSFREYRNIQAHDYTEEMFESFVKGLIENAPELLKLKKQFPASK